MYTVLVTVSVAAFIYYCCNYRLLFSLYFTVLYSLMSSCNYKRLKTFHNNSVFEETEELQIVSSSSMLLSNRQKYLRLIFSFVL